MWERLCANLAAVLLLPWRLCVSSHQGLQATSPPFGAFGFVSERRSGQLNVAEVAMCQF